MARKSKFDYKMIIIILIIIAVLATLLMGNSTKNESFINEDTFENIRSDNSCKKCSVK